MSIQGHLRYQMKARVRLNISNQQQSQSCLVT